MSPEELLKAIYMKQAVRERLHGTTLMFPEPTRRQIQKAALALDATTTVYDGGMVLVRPDVEALLDIDTTIMIDGKAVSRDPFECDLVDDLRHLVALDPNWATRRDGEGLGRSTTFKARRILAQCEQAYVHPNDLVEGEAVQIEHQTQLANFYSLMCGIPAEEVAGIREARIQAGAMLATERIEAVISEDFDFTRCTYLYLDAGGIGVHVAQADPHPLVDYRKSREHEPDFKDFYSENPRFFPSRTRTIGGDVKEFKSLLFPPHPDVAADLIQIVLEAYPGCLIEDGVYRLAEAFVPPQHTPPDPDDTPSGFRR
jgi:hypothetical protein